MEPSDHLFFEGTQAQSTGRPRRAPRTRHVRAESAEPLDDFYVWLFREAGLPAAQYRTSSLSRRMHACLRALGVKTPEEARRAIENDPPLLRSAINAVLLGVTEFCRDRPVFNALQKDVLPALLQKRSKIRVWSAACSEGQELYSLAILLGEAGCIDRCELVGTDCRVEAIEQARAGYFPAGALAGLPPSWAARHFTTAGQSCRVSDALRSATRWKVANLFAGAEPGPWDLILWRNMAIYLNPEAAEQVWASLLRELRPGGYVIAGKADYPPASLRLKRLTACVYQRRET